MEGVVCVWGGVGREGGREGVWEGRSKRRRSVWWERKDEAREGRERRERGCAGGSERWSEREREREGG